MQDRVCQIVVPQQGSVDFWAGITCEDAFQRHQIQPLASAREHAKRHLKRAPKIVMAVVGAKTTRNSPQAAGAVVF